MFQRSLLRASRQATRQLPQPQAAFAPIRLQVGGTRAAPTSLRWYSEQPAAKEGEAAENKAGEQPSQETTQLKEQMEKKDKEIIDLKVRLHLRHYEAIP